MAGICELPGQTEERRHHRKKVVQEARIRLPGQNNEIPCIIRDVSVSGVKLRVPMGFEAPDVFRLIAPALHINSCVRIAWRSQHSIGATFIADAERPD